MPFRGSRVICLQTRFYTLWSDTLVPCLSQTYMSASDPNPLGPIMGLSVTPPHDLLNCRRICEHAVSTR